MLLTKLRGLLIIEGSIAVNILQFKYYVVTTYHQRPYKAANILSNVRFIKTGKIKDILYTTEKCTNMNNKSELFQIRNAKTLFSKKKSFDYFDTTLANIYYRMPTILVKR